MCSDIHTHNWGLLAWLHPIRPSEPGDLTRWCHDVGNRCMFRRGEGGAQNFGAPLREDDWHVPHLHSESFWTIMHPNISKHIQTYPNISKHTIQTYYPNILSKHSQTASVTALRSDSPDLQALPLWTWLWSCWNRGYGVAHATDLMRFRWQHLSARVSKEEFWSSRRNIRLECRTQAWLVKHSETVKVVNSDI